MNFQLRNKTLQATFDTLGAELISLKSKEKEYIWSGNPDFWDKRSPILFPIIGSLKEETYFFEEKKYHLPRHGFAREKEFIVTQQNEECITFSLKDDLETLKVYPFHFELQIMYQLIENQIIVKYRVINNSNYKMFFSIGGHPGFALAGNFEDYLLHFETEKNVQFSLLENHLLSDDLQFLELTNKKRSLHYSLFEKDALVFTNHQIQSVIVQELERNFLKINFQNFPDLGIWTKVGAPFICIEPWFGHADLTTTNQNLVEKKGIQNLEKNQIFESIYSIEIL